MQEKVYRIDLDVLKGIAIIAVIFYHMGISNSGYLGVDVFFAINGFLIVPSIIKNISEERFDYFSFLKKRVLRLLPLVVLVSFVSLIVGYFVMLPDDYENLGESVVASTFFSSNILSLIISGDYWSVINDYKPIMHLWYIGILFEFYLVFPLIMMGLKKLSQWCKFGFYKYGTLLLIGLTVLSILLFLWPTVTDSDRFYSLQYRFFEISAGGLAGLYIKYNRKEHLYSHPLLSDICLVFLTILIFASVYYPKGNGSYWLVSGKEQIGDCIIPQNILLLITVVFTLFYLMSNNMLGRLQQMIVKFKIVGLLGVMSYSLYIWHQPILAFYRYCISPNISLVFLIIFILLLSVISIISYSFIENRTKTNNRTLLVYCTLAILVSIGGMQIYMKSGVVRDIPELGINKNNIHRHMNAEYCDRIFNYNKDFTVSSNVNDVKKILIVGNSFARDWANVLLESEYSDSICISYVEEYSESYINRIKQSDIIFVFDWKHKVPYYFWDNLKENATVWGIGTKNFGINNGVFYAKRTHPDYYDQTVDINPNFYKINDMLHDEWKNNYIDMISVVKVYGNQIRVFTDDKQFISQDCKHLTMGGAVFYANHLNLKNIIGI